MKQYNIHQLVGALLLCVLAVGTQQSVRGQSFRITHYQRDEGLPNELVKGIAIDSLGALWLATDEGLIHYNGLRFRQFKAEVGSNYVKGVLYSSRGDVLCASDMGVYRVGIAPSDTHIRQLIAGGTKTSDTSVWYPKQFYEDKRSRIWFSDNDAIWRLHHDSIRKYHLPKGNLTMSWQRSFSFVEDGLGQLYAFSQPGNLFVYRAESDSFRPVALLQPLPSISHVIRIGTNKLMVANTTGLHLLTLDSKAQVVQQKHLLGGFDVAHIQARNPNELWMGTWSQGLYLVKNIHTTPQVVRIANYPYNIASYLAVGAEDELWVASDNGIALVQEQYCQAPYQEQSRVYTQHIYQQSERQLYFTDGDHIFRARPDRPFSVPQTIASNTGSYYLALTSVNGQLWASDTNGFIHIFDNDQVVGKIDLRHLGKAIYYMLADTHGNVWLCQDGAAGVVRIDAHGHAQLYGASHGMHSHAMSLAISPQQEVYVGGSRDGHFLHRYNPRTDRFDNLSKDFDFSQPRDINIHQLAFHGDTLWLGTSFGLVKYQGQQFSPIHYGLAPDAVKAITIDRQGAVWFATSIGVLKLYHGELFTFDETDGMPTKTVSFRGLFADSNNQVWVATNAGVALFPNKQLPRRSPTPYFTDLRNDQQPIAPGQQRFLNNSLFRVRFSSRAMPSKYLQYQWRILGRDTAWQRLESLDGIFLSNLATGHYQLQVRCRQHGHYLWSAPLQFTFDTHTVWYKTWWAILGYILLLALGIWSIVRYNTQRLLRQKRHLEEIVAQRTYEVNEQKKQILEKNEELNQSNEELHTTLELVKHQKDELEQIHKNITDSIQYAQKIQVAMIPTGSQLGRLFPHHFILFRPRDIVSGDFYWYRHVGPYVYLAVADCTGHGVPGGFMSMLGISQLSELIHQHSTHDPAEVLNQLRDRIKNLLNQERQQGTMQDGMDIALCRIHLDHRQVDYAGANIHLIQISQQQLSTIRGDLMPIGSYPRDNQPFTNHHTSLQPGDTLYLASDGYVSQFGGQHGEKFKTRRLHHTLLQLQSLPMHQQEKALEHTLRTWQGTEKQVDDILVIGLRID